MKLSNVILNFDPETEVRQLIEVALADSLTKNGPTVIKSIVTEALSIKDGPYGRKSVLEDALNKAIRQAALNSVAKWMESHRQDIDSLVDDIVRKQMSPELVSDAVKSALQDLKSTLTLSPKKKMDNDWVSDSLSEPEED